MVRLHAAHSVAALLRLAPALVLAVLLVSAGAAPVSIAEASEAYLTDSATLLVADTENPSIVARVPVGGSIAASPAAAAGGLVYVPLASAVAVVDAPSRTVIKTIPLSMVVSDATLALGGRRLILAGQDSAQGVSVGVLNVVDTDARTVIATVPIGQTIGPMFVDPSGQRVYATYTDAAGIGGLVVLDPGTGTLLSGTGLPFNRAAAVAVHPTRSEAYAAAGEQISLVDIAAPMVRGAVVLAAPLPPQRRVTTLLRADPSRDLLYVFGSDVGPLGTQGFLAVIDTRAAAVIGEVTLPVSPEAAVVHADRERIYVSGEALGACTDLDTCPPGPGGIAVVDRVSYQVITVVQTGQGALLARERLATGRRFPPSLQIHPDGKTLYAAGTGGRVAVVDLDSLGLLALFPGEGLAFAPDLSAVAPAPRLYVIPATGGVPYDTQFGMPGDHLLPGDYDGDGRSDQAVWRPRDGSDEGVWLVTRSSDGGIVRRQWGAASLGDVPVPADYDGDRRLDLAVWRPFDGTWYILRSSDGAAIGMQWGGAELGDIPVPADYDGDGRADIAVWRPGSGTDPAMWFIVSSRSGTTSAIPLGVATDVPVPADYDGDGRVDPAVWRPVTGEWLILGSATGTLQTVAFGAPGDVPIPADYDGDGKADIAVWRVRTGEWFRRNGGSLPWGAAGDRPFALDFDGDGRVDRALVRFSGAAAPALPLEPLMLMTSGDGQGTTAGAGTYAPGTAVLVAATPGVGSTFAGWSGAPPCPQGEESSTSLVMPASPVTCTAVFALAGDPSLSSVAATSSGAGWVHLAIGGGRSPSWSNLTSDSLGRVYSLNWDGELWRFDGATNAWANLGKFFSDSRHNCTITGDPLNNRIWFTGQCSPASEGAAWVYDVATGAMSRHCADPCGSGGADSVGVFDPVNSRLLAWAGWLVDLSYYNSMRVLSLRPIAASWQDVPMNPAPVPFGECDRLAHNRGGWDSRRNRAWIVMADGALWTFEAGAWTRRATVGGPPHVCTVYAYHAGIDRIVGWTGVDYVTGSETPMIRQTWLLDPSTLTWSAGPSAAGGAVVPPGGGPTINSITYDAVRQQVVMRVGQETWGFRADGSALPTAPAPPPSTTPQTFSVTVVKAGNGSGTTVGGGTFSAGATVQLRATPAADSTFGGWSPAPCAATFIMPAQSLTCAAQFTLTSSTTPPPPQQFTVTLDMTGAGQGTVGGGGNYAAGALVQLTASPSAGSAFASWSPAPCASTFTMPAAPLICTATFVQATPPPPAGPIVSRVFTARPVPDVVFRSPFWKGNKDVSPTFNPDTGEVVTCTGDYSEPPQSSGHNTCYAYKIATNTWRMVAKPCGPPGSITPARPTDRGQFVYDTRAKRYLFRSLAEVAVDGSVCNDVAQPGDPTGSIATSGLLAYSEATKLWTKLFDGKAGVLNEGVFVQGATAGEDVLLHLGKGNSVCGLDGFTVIALNLATGVETTRATSCFTPAPRYSAGNGWVGTIDASSSRFAWDAVARRAFICGVHFRYASDVVVEKKFVCYRYDDTARSITPVAEPPAAKPGVTPFGLYTSVAWDSLHNVALMPVVGNDPCAVISQMLVYTPATDSWEDVPIVAEAGILAQDIRGNIVVFVPESNAFFIAGSGFCPPSLSVTVAPLLWRYAD